MRRLLLPCAAISLVLHAAALWPLVPHGTARDGMEAPPLVEVEFVDQAADTHGSIATAASQPPPAPQTKPPQPDGTAPPPPPPAPQGRPGPSLPTAVNLTGEDQDQDSLLVTGADVVPPRPDARTHNRPPNYPADAVRRRAQGVVGLVIHVTELGLPAWVEVRSSSGDTSLDHAARDAVALWRFQPAQQRGAAVPFDFEYNIRFTLGETEEHDDDQDRPRRHPRW